MSVTGLMNKTCTIKRKVLAQGTDGAMAPTLSSIATSVRCAVQVDNGSEALIASRETGTTTYRVYLPTGTDIKTQDQLSSITGMTNVVLDVRSIGMDDVGRGAYLKVRAEDRKGQFQTT